MFSNFLLLFQTELGVKILQLMEPLKTDEWAFNNEWNIQSNDYKITVKHISGIEILYINTLKSNCLVIRGRYDNINPQYLNLTLIDRYLIRRIFKRIRSESLDIEKKSKILIKNSTIKNMIETIDEFLYNKAKNV
jgi:hypothetical protein